MCGVKNIKKPKRKKWLFRKEWLWRSTQPVSGFLPLLRWFHSARPSRIRWKFTGTFPPFSLDIRIILGSWCVGHHVSLSFFPGDIRKLIILPKRFPWKGEKKIKPELKNFGHTDCTHKEKAYIRYVWWGSWCSDMIELDRHASKTPQQIKRQGVKHWKRNNKSF